MHWMITCKVLALASHSSMAFSVAYHASAVYPIELYEFVSVLLSLTVLERHLDVPVVHQQCV